MTATASDAPQRVAGLRTRSGNAMLRTRAAILSAAAACIERQGVRRTTMSDVAATGGVAKATLYNHFRTKDDVLAGLVEAQVAALAEACTSTAAEEGLAAALQLAATELATSPALRRVAAEEPLLLVPLGVPAEGRPWAAVHDAVAAVLAAGGVAAEPARVELVLRWLLSQLLWPVAPGSVAASTFAAGLGRPGGPATLRP